MPQRSSTAHKYSSGKVFVLAGSRGYTGAAALSASSALRGGAGAVVLGTPDAIYRVLARKLTEVIVDPLPSTSDGTLAQSALSAIEKRLEWADTVVIGPGLSRQKETSALVCAILERAGGNILLDADALNIVSDRDPRLLTKSKATLILTPHTGEFSRLSGLRAETIEAKRIDTASKFAKRIGHVVVLKGAPTVVADPGGDVVVNTTGNPGMATVGSGDVLSGIIASFWAQGMKPVQASIAGVYLHGLSGDLAAARLGQRSILAGDLQEYLPKALQHLEGVH